MAANVGDIDNQVCISEVIFTFHKICYLRKVNLKFLYIGNIKGTEAKANQK